MDPKAASSMEGLHAPAPDPFWQESWYFNFADAGAEVFGLCRIGMRPGKGRADGLALCSVKGAPVLLYPALGLGISGPGVRLREPEDLCTKKLRFACEKPMTSWRLTLSGAKAGFELSWQAMTPVFVFPSPSAGEGKSAARDHYEQAGKVSGTLRLGGERVAINGMGQRDHSWGPRNWAGVGAWTWISAQFDRGFAFNYWSVGTGSEKTAGGFFADEEEAVAVTEGEVSFDGDEKGRRHRGGRLRLALADGRIKNIRFTQRAFWPLYKDGALIFENFGTFFCEEASGVGVTEVLRRSRLGPIPMLRYAPGFARLAVLSR
ncbi:MAG: hypothetical protein AB1921_02380 [Thermodesulfobacteriota bacterium]